MGTVTVTSAGFAALPGTTPKNWPTNLVWPAGGSVNGTKPFTISDGDIQQMLSWIATNYNSTLVGTGTPPVTVTAIAYFLAWLQGFMNATTDAVQHHNTDTATKPPPITIS